MVHAIYVQEYIQSQDINLTYAKKLKRRPHQDGFAGRACRDDDLIQFPDSSPRRCPLTPLHMCAGSYVSTSLRIENNSEILFLTLREHVWDHVSNSV